MHITSFGDFARRRYRSLRTFPSHLLRTELRRIFYFLKDGEKRYFAKVTPNYFHLSFQALQLSYPMCVRNNATQLNGYAPMPSTSRDVDCFRLSGALRLACLQLRKFLSPTFASLHISFTPWVLTKPCDISSWFELVFSRSDFDYSLLPSYKGGRFQWLRGSLVFHNTRDIFVIKQNLDNSVSKVDILVRLMF